MLAVPAGGIASADPTISPNEAKFVHEVLTVGVTNDEADVMRLLSAGREICYFLNDGASEDQLADMIYQNSQESQGDEGINPSQSRSVVFLAHKYLCPEVKNETSIRA